jgi:hypothetical protein
MGLNNPCFGPGPCTYMYPMDPHHNVMWYQYIHGDRSTRLSNGTITDFILHSHQRIFDSAFLIKTNNDDVYAALESFRGHKRLPLILDCHHSGTTLATAKAHLLSRVKQKGGQVICEVTKPSLSFENDETGELQVYEKRAKLNCLNHPVELRVGDRLIVVAFNTVQKSQLTRRSNANAFGTFFAAYQHTIFRFTLTYDERNIEYAPPSYFYYADLGEDLDPNHFYPDKFITGTCSPQISYRMRQGWFTWFNWFWG